METHKRFQILCVAIVILSLLATVLFINGESLGITKIVDEDAEQNSDSTHFTSSDQNGSWDTSGATVITLTGDGATISGNGAYTNDGNVVITNGGCYVVSGTLTDGYLSVDAYDSSKVWILLDGVTINCSDDACIRVDQADKVFLTLSDNSQNTLTSGSSYSDEALSDGTDGAIFAHDDLTINGSGSLTVNAEYRHGIAANDDLVITGGTITVTAAADAVHANDSIRIKEASITLEAGDDGIVTSNEVENGYLYMESGSLTIKSGDDAIHTTGAIDLCGGQITINTGDDGIHSDSSVSISGGTILMESCYEGIEALTIDVLGGDITVYSEDDGFNANGGSGDMFGGMGGGQGGGPAGGRQGGRGRSGQDTSGGEMPARPDMGSTDGEMPVQPDTGSEAGTGTLAEADSEETYISISGGTITIINEKGSDVDGLDSNGDIKISGGTIYISLPGTGSNCAVDYASENGGTAEISGGTIIACGSSSMAEGFDSTSTQASILYNISSAAEAGTTVAIEDGDGNVLTSWEVPGSFTSALISCPQMQVGETYRVVIGDSAQEITIEEVAASYGEASAGFAPGGMPTGGNSGKGGPGGTSGEGMTGGPGEAPGEGMTGGPGGSSGEGMTESGQGTPPQKPEDMQGGTGETVTQEHSQQEISQNEEDQAAEQTVTAQPVDSKTWAVLGGCAALLIAAIAVGMIYKRH